MGKYGTTQSDCVIRHNGPPYTAQAFGLEADPEHVQSHDLEGDYGLAVVSIIIIIIRGVSSHWGVARYWVRVLSCNSVVLEP